MRTPTIATAAALALTLTACGSKPAQNADPASGFDYGQPVVDRPHYASLLKDLRNQYPRAGWTLALAKEAGDNVCTDMRNGNSYEAIVQNRAGVVGGDRGQAQELVISSVLYVCPDLKDKVPGLS